MYNKKMKNIIKKALNTDVINIQTKDGYNQADILSISSYNIKQLEILLSLCKLGEYGGKIIKEEKTPFNNLETDLYVFYGIFSEDKNIIDYIPLKYIL